MRTIVLLGCALAVGTSSADAMACATCGCGDPTLAALGAERPYANRVRPSVDLRYRTDAIGEPGVDRIALAETRVDAQLAWAPTSRVFLLATAPVLRRTIDYVNDARTSETAFGDAELRLKVFVAEDRASSSRHLLAVLGGLKLPTAPREHAADGSLLPTEAQPGTGSWDPIVGIGYAFIPRPWAFYASAQGSMPLRGTSEFRSSASLRTSLALQRQLAPQLAVRLGVDVRLDSRSFEDGKAERDSSGVIGFVSPELVVSPISDLVLVFSVRVPALQALAGYHREGPVIGMAVAYDL